MHIHVHINHLFIHHVCEVMGGCLDAYLRPREPQRGGRPRLLQPSGGSALIWQETRAVTAFLQVGSLLWSLSTWVTGSFVTGVPPLRIPDQTFLVTASSYGRCGGTTEDNMLWKTASVFGTIKKASYCKTPFTLLTHNGFPHSFLSEYLHVGVLPSFHLFIFH